MLKRVLSGFISCVFVVCLLCVPQVSFAPPVLPNSGCFQPITYFSPDGIEGISCDEDKTGDLTFGLTFDWGKVFGTGICSTSSSSDPLDMGTPSSSNGQYCWCSLTGFDIDQYWSASGSSTYAIFFGDLYDSTECTKTCGCACADLFNDPGALLILYGVDPGSGTDNGNSFCIDSGNGCTTLRTLDPNFCDLELDDFNGTSATGWYANFVGGNTLEGEARCTDQHAANEGDIGTPGSTNGKFCWCRATEYFDGTNTYTATSSDWFYMVDMNTYADCSTNCSKSCPEALAKKHLCDLGSAQFCLGDTALHVTYSCNGGGGTAPTDSNDYDDGDTVITVSGASNTCTPPTNQVFLGWNCGGTFVPAGGTFTINDNTTCNAMYSTFSVGTTSMASGSSIQFSLSAQGTFYVNCGTGGTLSGPSGSGVVGNTITKNNTTEYTYTCSYTGTTGTKTIGFAGTATAYSGSAAAISFHVGADGTAQNANAAKVTAINGGLSSIFPQLSSGTYRVPKFGGTFEHTSITSIPSGLFSGYTTSIDHMFDSVFYGCTGITSIPSNLFGGITAGADYMFAGAFYGCTGITSIPSGLFTNITSGGSNMFMHTFTASGLTGANAIPSNLFTGITTGATEMFRATFSNCANLTAIPSGLFSHVTTGAPAMFMNTFSDCTSLTSIPSGLFASITTAASMMFKYTFTGDTGLTGYIPPDLFAGLTPKQASYPSDMMYDTFDECTNLATSCPSGTATYTTGYEYYWDSHVSCSTAYTVSYACGAHGSGSPTDSNSPYLPNATVTTLASSACTAATGYNFNGWNCGNTVNSGNNITAGGTFSMPASNVTCTAQWTPKTTTITYDCGTGSIISGQSGNMTTTFTYAAPYSFAQASTLCQKTGYTVYPGSGNVASHNAYGWICKYNNNTTPASTYGAETGQSWNHTWADLTCTAQWLPNTYTVTYNCNGGSPVSGVTMSDGFQYDSSYSLAAVADKCTRLGYDPTTSGSNNVGGWVCSATTQATYLGAASGAWTTTLDYTCYAQWRTHTTAVTYNCNGGSLISGQSSSTTFTFDTSYTVPDASTKCTRNGYSLKTSGTNIIANGWKCSLGSGYLNNATGIWSSMENTMTCNAQWDQNYVTYSCGDHGTMGVAALDYPTYGGSYTVKTYAQSGCSTIDVGYTFNNWNCVNISGSTVNQTWNAGQTINPWNYNANVLCTAQWTANTYNITYAPGSIIGQTITGSTAGTTATYGQSATLATNGYSPQGRGYSFSTWRCQGGNGAVDIQYSSGQTVDPWPHAYDLTCTAQWAQDSTAYTITYSCGDGTGTPPANGSATFNTSFTPAANTCSRTGYTFGGWLISGTDVVKPAGTAFTWTYTGNRTLTAQWIPNTYTVTYNCTGGSAVVVELGGGMSMQVALFEDMTYGDSYTLPLVADKCTRTGYNPSSSNSGNYVNGWVCIQGDGQQIGTEYLPSASGTWTYNSNYYCEAQWNAINYTVSFAGGSTVTGATPTGSTSSLTNKHYQDTVTLPSSTFNAPAGFTFDKWNCNNGIGNKNAGATFSMPAANVTCTAQWKYVDYTVSFDANGGSGTMNSQTGKHYGDTITLPSNSFTAPTGKEFDKWNCDNSIGDKAPAATFSMPAANVTCTAQWKYINYTIDFAPGNCTGTMSSQPNNHYGDTITLPANGFSVPTGRQFDGWNCGASVNNGNNLAAAATFSMPAADITCTAQCPQTNYTVSFDKGAGTGTMSSQTGKHYQDTITLPSSTFTPPTGKEFDKWNCDNSIGDKAAAATFSMPAANVTCTAQYKYRDYTVYFAKGDGTGTMSSQTGKHYGDTITLPTSTFTPPTPTGKYMFDKWSCNNSIGDKAEGATFSMPAADVTCTAQYKYIDYTVNFAKGYCTGTMNPYTGKHYGDTITLPSNSFSVPTGRQFTGWNCDNSIGDKAVAATFSMPAANVTCTAQCPQIDYTVSFAKGDGTGTMSSQTGKHYGDTITLPSSTFTAPTGKTFDKWNCDNSIGDKAAGATFSMPNANVICTAQYKFIDYTVSFAPGSGSGTMSSQTGKHYGDTITLPSSTFTAPTGRHFTSWSCDNNIGNKAAEATFSMPAANVTCTAQWTVNTTTISYACGTGTSGSAPSSGTASYNSNFIFAANNTCAKTGYRFDGWTCNGLSGIQLPNANLPSGYTQLAYIQSSGTQYIDTGFKFTGDVATYSLYYVRPSNQSGVSLLGASNNDTNWSGVLYYPATTTNRLYVGTTGSLNSTSEAAGTRYDYYLTVDRVSNTWKTNKNGTSASGSFSGTVTDTTNVTLFAHNKNTAVWQKSSYRNYGTKITQDASLVHNFVPAKNSSNVVGMYDTVTGTFKQNAGTGSFSSGNPTWTYTGAHEGTMSCTAVWTQLDYKVSFDANGGSGTMNSQTLKHYGDTITLPSNSFTAPTGKEFDKWNCDNSIGNKAAAATFSMPAANVTCTAQWKYINYTVSFAKGDGSGTMSGQTGKHYGDTITLPASTFTAPTGKEFEGWKCGDSISNNATLAAGDTFSMPAANVTCTAQWKYIDYSVSFAAGSGSGTMDSQTNKHYQDTITLPSSTFTAPTGYHFDKWSCDNSIGDKAATATFSMPAADVICTAQYVANTTTVTYACGTGTTGSAPSSGTATYDSNFIFAANNTCAKAGHRFMGWECSGLNGLQVANANLPSGYTQVKYLKSTGVQQINTGFTPTVNFRHTMVFLPSGTSEGYITGTIGSTVGRSGNVRLNNKAINGIFINKSSAVNILSTTTSAITTRSTLTLDLRNNAVCPVTLNGTAINDSDTGTISSGNSLKLFRMSSDAPGIYLYYDMIEEGNTVVRNFIPAKNSSNVPGLYDTVTGSFKTNTGTGSFTYGNPVWDYAGANGGTMACTASWLVMNYTVSFVAGDSNNNGTGTVATGSTAALTGTYGETVTLPASTFTAPDGYQFDGWSCDNSIGDKAVGATFSMPTANVTCTAQYVANTLDLTWYKEDGTTVVSNTPDCTYGQTFTGLPTPPEKPGYHFKKWNVAQ